MSIPNCPYCKKPSLKRLQRKRAQCDLCLAVFEEFAKNCFRNAGNETPPVLFSRISASNNDTIVSLKKKLAKKGGGA